MDTDQSNANANRGPNSETMSRQAWRILRRLVPQSLRRSGRSIWDALKLTSRSNSEQMLARLRRAERERKLKPRQIQELAQTFVRILQVESQKKLGGAELAPLFAAFDLANYNDADRLIHCLRNVERRSPLPLTHFDEVVDTVYRLAWQHAARMEVVGAHQIRNAQMAIIRNLAATIIDRNRFLVLDVGASDGWFIDRILSEPRDVHIVAFEPLPTMLPDLMRRQKANAGMEVFAEALGDVPGVLQLRSYPAIPGLSSLLNFEEGYEYFRGAFDANDVHVVDVPVSTLDQHFDAHPHLKPYQNIAIKIDVQGFEDRVLRGGARLLASGRVKAILIELVTRPKYAGSWDYLTIIRHLDQLGFVVYDINPFYREIEMTFQSAPYGRLTEMDCLFVHSDFIDKTVAKAA